jgi:glutamate-ammonia-ligase adenylyltransferase
MAAGAGSLAERLSATPVVDKAREAKARLADLMGTEEAAQAGLRDVLAAHAKAEALLLGVADHSPFLWRLASRDPARLVALLSDNPHERLAQLLDRTRHSGRSGNDEAEVKVGLRLARQELALLVALADCGGLWSVEQVTAALTGFADAAVGAALDFLLRDLAAAGRIALPDAGDPSRDCGLVILALGKHGAGELNYSSDVDLVVFFDPEKVRLAEGLDPTTVFARLIKGLVRILQDATGDGHVLRVDLRLRPDPASTATVISLPAAFT